MLLGNLLVAPWRSRPAVVRIAVVVGFFLVAVYVISTSSRLREWTSGTRAGAGAGAEPGSSPNRPPLDADKAEHPIDLLIHNAEREFDDLLSHETTSLHDAAARYRQIRGRHPPPNFDRWYAFARRRKAVMVEEFFDPIYHDLSPYWGRPPAELRLEARALDAVIQVRNGKANRTDQGMRTPEWTDLISSIAGFLPDLDIPCNGMDEPRLMVPWEDINDLVAKERRGRSVTPAGQTKSSFSVYPLDASEPGVAIAWEPYGGGQDQSPPFERARRGCPPDSAARQATVAHEWRHPELSMANAEPHSYKGYVQNTSLAASLCHQPDLQSNQGIFVEPVSLSTSSHLYPMFGECKLSTGNEILLPSAVYWATNEQYSGGDDHGVPWAEKIDAAIWRGANAGGRNHDDNWTAFQRPRFVAMVNGSKVQRVETGEEQPLNFELPSASNIYGLQATKARQLGGWLSNFTDVGFVTLECFPKLPDHSCPYLGPQLAEVAGVPMPDQYRRKYLPDIDGNSFSGRYRAFLLSTSVPIKSTIFREWHDSRLVAWKHYVPMDARFGDFYGIMEYLHGYEVVSDANNVVPGHDAEAQRIAEAGRTWADRVLRKEDMQIYTLLLLLEYARVLDDDRAVLGFVGDLTSKSWFSNLWA
ncbi:MAG: hypothetical protein M1838_003801 [Thelocarpon superellum]|nr:MAG: hypothetical protein M1838_003801 [Thelocarpon superellum]